MKRSGTPPQSDVPSVKAAVQALRMACQAVTAAAVKRVAAETAAATAPTSVEAAASQGSRRRPRPKYVAHVQLPTCPTVCHATQAQAATTVCPRTSAPSRWPRNARNEEWYPTVCAAASHVPGSRKGAAMAEWPPAPIPPTPAKTASR